MKNNILLLQLFLLLPFCVFGQWLQIGQTVNGEAADDRFGRSVCMSDNGNIVAIGGYFNDGVNGGNSGHVRVYQNIGEVWIQIGNDIDGEASGDDSGFSIDLSDDGNIVAIGARNNNGVNGDGSGHVRVYENIGGIWSQIGDDIDGEEINDLSGQAVSLSGEGNIVAIGAGGNEGVNGEGSGHVRVYEYSGGVWAQIGDDIDGETPYDNSGLAVALNYGGNVIAIGAAQNDGVNGGNSGHVRVYENLGGVWTQIGDDIDGEAANDASGGSVSLNNDGNIIAIGAFYNDSVNGENAGHVRVYENLGGVWVQIGDDIEGEDANNFSGISVNLNNTGNILAIGATGNNGVNGENSGHVRIFENLGGVWTQIGDDIDGEAAGDASGISISLRGDGGSIAIGAWRNDNNGIDSGQFKVFGNASLSIETNTLGEKISLYPNPTSGISTITFGKTYNIKLLVYDSMGKIVKQEAFNNIDSLQINSQEYADGIYLLHIISDMEYWNLKLIKR